MLIYGNSILAFLFVVVLFPTDKTKIDLPTYSSLKVVKTIYEYPRKEKSNLFGDGYYGKVVQVKESDMKNFINNLAYIDWGKHKWTEGDLLEYKMHLKVLEYIEKGIKETIGNEEFKKLNKAIDLNKIKQNKKIYHKVKYQKSDDDFIRDAEIWILIPSKNIVCIFSFHT